MSGLINHRREVALPGLWHDYANLFPMLDAAAQDRLREDVQTHGVREPVIIYAGRILDGRNRYMAARDLVLDFPVADFDGSPAEALAYVLSTNLHRRHLTESQRAAVAAKLANLRPGNPGFANPANLPDCAAPVSQAQAAEMLNVSERSVRAAKSVLEHGAPETIRAVESGAVSVSAAAAVMHLPYEEQAATVAEGPKAVVAKASQMRDAKRAGVARADLQPEEVADPAEAKARRELAKLTPDAMVDEILGLRAELAERKAKGQAMKAENDDLKEKLREATADDLGAAVGRLQRRLDHANYAKGEALKLAAKAEREVRHLKKRVAELEAMGIEIPV